MKIKTKTCIGIYCGKRMNRNTGGGFRYRAKIKFLDLDWIPCRVKGFCSVRCMEETPEVV